MSTAQSLITQSQKDQFENEGYIILPKVLSPDVVEGARQSVQELIDIEADKLMKQGLISDLFKDEPFETRWLRLFENKLDLAPDSFRPELHLAGFYPVFFDSNVLDAVETFLGSEIRLYPNYTVRAKIPDHAKAVVLWHQDGGYTAVNSAESVGHDVDEMRMVNVWSPLVPANRQNGCMQFVPGTHKLGVVPHEKKKYYLEIADEYLKPREKDAIDIELDPGDIVLFSNLLFHRGLPNLTKAVRWSMDWRYQDANQDTLRKEKGHIARSRQNPESAINSAKEWTDAIFE
jgi:ectoine hydroxylase-related dioxygenase (phytanoyl-CoA dioxygenase family)